MSQVRIWKHGETTDASDIADRNFRDEIVTVQDSIICTFETCEKLYSQWAASDYSGSFFQYAYAEIIANMLTDHDRIVRATNKINRQIGRPEIAHLIGGPDF